MSSNPAPEGRAALLLVKHHVTAAPVPVEDIAAREGLRIGRNRHNGPEFSFSLNDDGTGHAMIGINTGTHQNRQRGATAHGLGHALMHAAGRVIIVCRAVRRPDDDTIGSSPSRREEAEASAFSAALLMPDDLFIPAAIVAAEGLPTQHRAARDEITETLGRQFGVSADAAAFRLITLGLLAV
jgi:Zn-dependent peptidase ImmA (M78 family)